MLSDLRQFQRDGRLPAFPDFMQSMCDREDLSPSQKVPLRQRLEVLRHFVAESSTNQRLLDKQVERMVVGTYVCIGIKCGSVTSRASCTDTNK